MKSNSVGIVKYEDFCFKEGKELKLQHGGKLKEINVRYERYGKLNAERTNAILIIHALTANHHAAGKYHPSDKHSGWWEMMIGPGKAFDTNHYQVICSNNLGGCDGTTGPNSINPTTGKPYGLNFPSITISDMVAVQYRLMKHLNIPAFHTLVGPSMGGMMALEWAIRYPNKVKNVIAIATTSAQGAQSIAFSEVGRQAIMSDPDWKNGNYFNPRAKKKTGPRRGLAIARMLAHITYLSSTSMKRKFGRRLRGTSKPNFTFDPQFQVESYLRHQGNRFIDRFDANSYLYITKALNYFDLGAGFSSLAQAFRKTSARYLFVSFSSDWIYTKEMSLELMKAAFAAKQQANYFEIVTETGHDAFLLEHKKLTELTQTFLQSTPLPTLLQISNKQKQKTKSLQKKAPSKENSFFSHSHSLPTPAKSNEFKIIASQIPHGARVLDIGCADGTLLNFLQTEKAIKPYGIEKNHQKAMEALRHNLFIFQGTAEETLPLYSAKSFDVVILSRTIQQLENPVRVIDQMLKIGKIAIISFLNYGYFTNRFNLFLKGQKPRSTAFPHNWHDSPDIHLLSIKDFETYIKERQYSIQEKIFLKGNWLRRTTLLPNLLAGVAIYVLTRKSN